MSLATILFLIICIILLLSAPRPWPLLPLFMGACYMTIGQAVTIGPFHFSFIRILVAVGVLRVILKKERPANGLNNKIDQFMLLWAVIAICSSAFHNVPKDTLVNHLGLVYNTLGFYFLIRCFCQSEEDVKRVVMMIAIVLIPVAFEMLNEQFSHHNFFSIFSGVPEVPAIRSGRLRSQGPFRHAILAGTVGAVCTPLMIGIWLKYPRMAKIGTAACILIVVTSASSGPLMSLIISGFAIILWRLRNYTREMRICALLGYLLLEVVMNAPPYYIIARIDLTGSSTGWHRAKLIESAFAHLSEWWLAGTDYTRHWMPTGVSWSPNHTDITNHYLMMGVTGGLPLMIVFIAIIWYCFKYIGETLRMSWDNSFQDRFLVWCIGASLFAHAATCISVSYFDQSELFLYLNIAIITSLRMAHAGHKVST